MAPHKNYIVIDKTEDNKPTNVPIKAWINGIEFEDNARRQVCNIALMDKGMIFPHIAIMPDAHIARGATIGSVIPMVDIIIPSAVGVDIGCGILAKQTKLKVEDIEGSLSLIHNQIEKSVPHGHTGGRRRDKGAWWDIPDDIAKAWNDRLKKGFHNICQRNPIFRKANHISHLGTLGTGNHFLEICKDEENYIWVTAHTGSRGIGHSLATHHIGKAKLKMAVDGIDLIEPDLAYFKKSHPYMDDYMNDVYWAQDYAATNREVIVNRVINILKNVVGNHKDNITSNKMTIVNCHHNYVSIETHFNKRCYVTRKGAISAKKNQLGIIPSAMNQPTYIVKGLGNKESFNSCSHGAGRAMSCSRAREEYTMDDLKEATKGLKYRLNAKNIDDIPSAYKDIEKVMAAQNDLIEISRTLYPLMCIKG